MRKIDCSGVDDEAVASLYLSGKLPESDSEAFELHYLGCDRCAAAVREAGEIRAAFGKPVLVAEPARLAASSSGERRSGRQDVWTVLAAAAAVAAFFYGLGHLARRPEVVVDPAALRSANTDVLPLTITAGLDGQVVLEWPSHPEAQSYRIEIVRSDGLPVLESETPDRRVGVAIADLPPRPPGIRLLARVEAVDAMRRVVAKSAAEPVPGSSAD
jgi:hypothetical protein